MIVSVNEFVGFGGFGGSVNAIELEFLNLLHIKSSFGLIIYRASYHFFQKKTQKNYHRFPLQSASQKCGAFFCGPSREIWLQIGIILIIFATKDKYHGTDCIYRPYGLGNKKEI